MLIQRRPDSRQTPAGRAAFSAEKDMLAPFLRRALSGRGRRRENPPGTSIVMVIVRCLDS